jgi:hypothetical protein
MFIRFGGGRGNWGEPRPWRRPWGWGGGFGGSLIGSAIGSAIGNAINPPRETVVVAPPPGPVVVGEPPVTDADFDSAMHFINAAPDGAVVNLTLNQWQACVQHGLVTYDPNKQPYVMGRKIVVPTQ